MNTIFGGLFNYETKESLDDFIKEIDENSAKKIIELSLLYCQKMGMFTLEESHIVYICLNKIKNKKDEDIILPDNNSNGNSSN